MRRMIAAFHNVIRLRYLSSTIPGKVMKKGLCFVFSAFGRVFVLLPERMFFFLFEKNPFSVCNPLAFALY